MSERDGEMKRRGRKVACTSVAVSQFVRTRVAVACHNSRREKIITKIISVHEEGWLTRYRETPGGCVGGTGGTGGVSQGSTCCHHKESEEPTGGGI